MIYFNLICLTLLSLSPSCLAVCTGTSGCYPPLANIPTKPNAAAISASSTCEQSDTLSCPFGLLIAGDLSQCYNCNAQDYAPSMAIDGSIDTWWQAPNDESTVTLRLDFSRAFLISEITLIWQNPRPRTMVLEFSTDNATTWTAYQTFSSDCESDFPEDTPDPAQLQTGTTCDSSQSALNPHSRGDTTFSPAAQVAGGIFNASSAALSYLLVTNLRVRVMGFNRLVLTEGYFHAVSEWRVQGSCFCNGHGDACGATLPHVCRCGHNTEGDNCQRCQPLFNNHPYLQGTTTEANECQACQCYAHSTACEYDSSKASGVCQACQHNTTGDNCDTCLPFFYQHPTLPLIDPGICPPCDCNTEGTSDSGVCETATGNCNCKGNVMGRQCDQCRLGFFNLSSQADGCEPCGCVQAGSLSTTCHSESGQCACKQNVEGRQCDTCKDGFYQLSIGNDQGCVPCGCDAGGSSSPVCDKVTGECQCLRNVTGSKCDGVESGFYIPSPEHLIFEGESGNIGQIQVPGYEGLAAGVEYTGTGLARVERGERLELVLTVPRLNEYVPVLRYFTPQAGRVMVEISLMDNIERCETTNRVQSAVLNSSTSYHALLPTCLQDSFTRYLFSLTPTEGALWVDALLLVPDLSPSPLYSAEVGACIQTFYSLYAARNSCQHLLFSISADFYQGASPCLCDTTGASSPICDPFGGQCPCRGGVTFRDCSGCSPGYHSFSPSGCSACDCDSTGARNLPCDANTGQCVCKTGVADLRCDTCATSFYNLSSSGCDSCACSEFSAGQDCDSTGACTCLPGVTGEKCTQCSTGYFNISAAGCENCDCSRSTSSSLQCSEQGICPCINGFSGDKCPNCSVGNYVSTEDSTPVCEECKCFTQATSCSNLTTGYAISQHINNFTSCDVVEDIQLVDCTMGWTIQTGLFLPLLVNEFVTFLITSPTQVYWQAPRVPFLGDRSLSYGLNIVFSVFSVDLLDEPEFVGDHPDIILTGGFIQDQLVSSFPRNLSSGPGAPFSIPLVETNWRVGDPLGPLATYAQLIQVLANLTSLQVRARYSEASIARVSMEYFILETLEADPGATGVIVEDCDCPAPYQPPFCNVCSQGYYRPSSNPTHACVPCLCNGHTTRCDPITGLCLDCQHNTTGGQCQICSDGFYGNATIGTATDCESCPCPLPTQSFSPTCVLDADGLPTCDSCYPGYTGRRCEMCEDGYFGTPTLPGAICTNCSCSNNIDLSQPGNCNTTSGECIRCLNNSAGFYCEECALGYFRDALSDTCSPCQCDPMGSRDNNCNTSTGVCNCSDHVVGEECNECEAGYWGLHFGLPGGCLSCDCCNNGSTGRSCDTNTGVCSCQQNVGGDQDIKCCRCSDNAFNFTEGRGCDLCGCVPGAALSESCEQSTGVCLCEAGVEGDKCDVCAFGYTGTSPRCDKCPQCFDNWLELVEREQLRVELLNSRVDSLLSSYQPLTVENISLQISELNSQVSQVSSQVQASQLNDTQLARLDGELVVLSSNLTILMSMIAEIETSLNNSLRNVQLSMQFDGNVEVESGEIINATSLMAQLREIMMDIMQAEARVAEVRIDIATANTRITVAQVGIDESRVQVQQDSNRSAGIATQQSSINSTIASFTGAYARNKKTLGGLQLNTDNLVSVQNESRRDLADAYSQARATQNRTALAKVLAEGKDGRANSSLSSIQLLQNQTDSATAASAAAKNVSLAALEAILTAESNANQATRYQAGNLTELTELRASGEETEMFLEESLSVTGTDPSRAEVLSSEINRLDVPIAVVESIRGDANASLARAMSANEIALEAQSAASNASSLLSNIVNNINFTQATQIMTTNVSIENAKNALESAAVAIGEFYQNTGELLETSERIFALGRGVSEVQSGVDAKGRDSVGNATVAEGHCRTACEEATQLVVSTDQAANHTGNISNLLSTKEDDLTIGLNTIQSLINSTESLLQNVTSVQLSRLGDLMRLLQDEEDKIDDLMKQAEMVESEIAETERSISTLADMYQSCPN